MYFNLDCGFNKKENIPDRESPVNCTITFSSYDPHHDFDDYDLDEVSLGFVRLVTFWQISLFLSLPGKVFCFL